MAWRGDIGVADLSAFFLVLAIYTALLGLQRKLCLVCTRRAATTFRRRFSFLKDDSTSKLELERRYAEENKKIQKELDLLRKTKASPRGFSAFVLLVFLLSSLLGYLMFGSRA
ncbi:Homeodomain-like superfamily protein [Zea mays]|uniref:Homeodomain-like superfamily protein n=1 Tax=Zea mays TaxID=4577 RepID=B4FVH3_MAIZE|nr:unknown [Zea mays]AQK73308.1 Homeodomain-like superfamily protein [Zea mays]